MRTTIAMISALVMSSAAVAGTINEMEPNDTIDAAQSIVVSSGQTTLQATIADSSTKDVDFYKFYAKAGDVIDIDVNNGIGGTASVDTIAAVFGPDPDYTLLRENDDASSSDLDPMIKGFVAPSTGYYLLAVSAYPAAFADAGDVITDPVLLSFLLPVKTDMVAGDYEVSFTSQTQTVSSTGQTPSSDTGSSQTVTKPVTLNVSIMIKPGSGDTAPVNIRSKGKIPVAILSSPVFKAQSVDTKSLTFGATGNEQSLDKCDWTDEDVNGDWLLDKVCHFDTQKANFSEGDLEGELHGKTLDGQSFEGRGYIKIKGRAKH